MTPKQKAFFEEWVRNGQNGAAAYRTAYNTKAGAKKVTENASKILRHPEIAPLVAEHRSRQRAAVKKVIARYEVTEERLVAELARLAFSNMEDYTRLVGGERIIDLSEADRDHLAAVSELTVEDFTLGRGDEARDVRRVKLKLHDKRGSIVDLLKKNGAFIERHEHTGKNGGPLETVAIVTTDPVEAAKIYQRIMSGE